MANTRRSEWWQQPSWNTESVGRGASEKTQWSAYSDSLGGSGERAETVADTTSLISNGGGRGDHSKEGKIQREIGRKSSFLANSTASGSQASPEACLEQEGSEEAIAIGTCSGTFQPEGNWSVEPNVGRVADGISDRIHRIKSLGNAVVPQLTYIIGMSIIKAMQND